MNQSKLNNLLITLVLSSASIGAFASVGDTPYTLSQKNTISTTSPKYAYLAVGFSMDMVNKNAKPNPTMVQVCNVEKDGNLTNCTDSGMKLGYPTAWMVRADAVAIHDNFAYISNNTEGQITKCTIGADGHLSSCQNTGSRVGYGPSWISIHNDTAYIAQQFMNQVSKCNIDSNGELANCVSTGSNFVEPTAVSFNGNHAYITAPNQHKVTICNVTSDNSFSNCNLQDDIGLGRNYNIAFNNGMAYAPNGNTFLGGVACHNLVKKCTIAKDGTFEKCSTAVSDTGIGGGFYNLFGVSFNNNFAYAFNNSYQGSVYTPAGKITTSTMISKCSAENDGSLANCQYISGNFDGVTGIAFK